MADSVLGKATSALGDAKETVTASAASAKETVAASAESAKETATASAESAKTASAETAKAVSDETSSKSNMVKDAVDNAVTRGFDGANTLLHNLEAKKGEVSSSIMGAVSHFTGSADSTTNRDLPVSTDNQPLLSGERGVETSTPWWKNCCGVLDLLKDSSSSSTR